MKAELYGENEKEILVQIGESENEVGAKLERWSRLITYVISHELLHAFGIPHLEPPDGRTDLLMDEKISFRLLSYWKGTIDITKYVDAEFLHNLLTPKQEAYLEFILKSPAPSGKTGFWDPANRKKIMGCEFTEINGRCYFGAGLRGPEGQYFDLFKDENGQIAERYGTVDPQDLFQPPDAKEPSPVQPDVYYSKDRDGRLLSLGHFYGRSIETLHPGHYRSYFGTPHWGNLLAVSPTGLARTKMALLSNDLSNFLVDDEVPRWQKPITDDVSPLLEILERLKEITLGKLHPPRVYDVETKQKEYEEKNSRRALEIIHFYWRLGSNEAGRILDRPVFKKLLENYGIERKDRFKLIGQKLADFPRTQFGISLPVRNPEETK